MKKPLLAPALAGFCAASVCLINAAPLSLNGIFKDGMVLQRGIHVPVWGRGDPDASVAVSFAGQTVRTRSDGEGDWEVRLLPLTPGNPQTLEVTDGKETCRLENVLVGDVWLCSGQSNMAIPVKDFTNAAAWLRESDCPDIRLFTVDGKWRSKAEWSVCNATTANAFSALGFLFGRELQREIKVPIGLIGSASSGSIIQKWMADDDPAHGDLYRSMSIADDGKIVIKFDHTGGGLVVSDGVEPRHFTIAGENQRFTPARTRIQGTSVVVWSETVAVPVAVRYAWQDNPEGCNLFNQEGLPAAPFRTDAWRLRTWKED